MTDLDLDAIQPSETRLSQAMMQGLGKVCPTEGAYFERRGEEVFACAVSAAVIGEMGIQPWMDDSNDDWDDFNKWVGVASRLWPRLRRGLVLGLPRKDRDTDDDLFDQIISALDYHHWTIPQIAEALAREGL